MKITIKNIIKESKDIDPKQRYINGIVKIINPPYFYNLRVTETPEYLWNDIFYRLFNQKVIIDNNRIYDSNNNQIYFEGSDGYWLKREYDSYGNLIYRETSDEYWEKSEYDSYGNLIYRETSDGTIRDNR